MIKMGERRARERVRRGREGPFINKFLYVTRPRVTMGGSEWEIFVGEEGVSVRFRLAQFGCGGGRETYDTLLWLGHKFVRPRH